MYKRCINNWKKFSAEKSHFVPALRRKKKKYHDFSEEEKQNVPFCHIMEKEELHG